MCEQNFTEEAVTTAYALTATLSDALTEIMRFTREKGSMTTAELQAILPLDTLNELTAEAKLFGGLYEIFREDGSSPTR